jgi:hypothetical protein
LKVRNTDWLNFQEKRVDRRGDVKEKNKKKKIKIKEKEKISSYIYIYIYIYISNNTI